MLMIRLRRGGAKHHPLYRIVVSDSRSRPTSDYLDQVGLYNPHTDPPELSIDFDKVERWTGQGAGVSETVRSLLRKAKRQQ
jgi:small subunit ribosomal protein S16